MLSMAPSKIVAPPSPAQFFLASDVASVLSGVGASSLWRAFCSTVASNCSIRPSMSSSLLSRAVAVCSPLRGGLISTCLTPLSLVRTWTVLGRPERNESVWMLEEAQREQLQLVPWPFQNLAAVDFGSHSALHVPSRHGWAHLFPAPYFPRDGGTRWRGLGG